MRLWEKIRMSKQTMKDRHIFLNSKQVWDNNLKIPPDNKLSYPDENLVRLFFGRHVTISQSSVVMLDHGFETGKNLVFFANKGYDCASCERSQNLIDEADSRFRKINKPVNLKLVKDLAIPFDDEEFEIVVSWNVLHYNGTRLVVSQVIDEFPRFLKPVGVFILSTVSLESSFSDRLNPLTDGSYLIEKESRYDDRMGGNFFYS